jgi:hypothetical protein
MAMVESPFSNTELSEVVGAAAQRIEAVVDAEIRKGKPKLQNSFTIHIEQNELNYTVAVQNKVINDYKTAGWDTVKFVRQSAPYEDDLFYVVIEKMKR